ncbi:MAG: helix-turn-helix transcriptional regulator [Colwellia sp.]|nr:helix-turn-helix transcriptional regulator [Colwellia sp.]MCW9081444.1 helix-turn-helix transcriptional regulator [Colwellia sp.]
MAQFPAKFSIQQVDDLNRFIGELYLATSKIELAEYRDWALSQLQSLIQFDGAIWSNGHQQTVRFHNHTLVNVPESLTQCLLDNLAINPIADKLFDNLGSPIDMRDLMTDDDFYRSEIYLTCFKPHGIERILSSVHLDERTGLFTLLTLYRFERNEPFSAHDKKIQKQALYHLLTAAKHALFLQLEYEENTQSTTHKNSHKAICDSKGYFHQVQTSFIDLLEQYYPENNLLKLPFTLNMDEKSYEVDGLQVELKLLNDLVIVEIWPQGPLDSLSVREQEIVQILAKGLTFKEAARELDLSPSTVSNHLYRIYQKLNIGSKSELFKLLP